MRTGLVLPSRIGNWATTLSVATSMTVTFPPAPADAQARVPSGVKATVRGLSPTCSVFRTRPVFASRTETVLFVSAVTYSFVPSRVTPTPSGSTPTGVENSVLPLAMSMADACAISSFDTYDLPVGAQHHELGVAVRSDGARHLATRHVHDAE